MTTVSFDPTMPALERGRGGDFAIYVQQGQSFLVNCTDWTSYVLSTNPPSWISGEEKVAWAKGHVGIG